MSARPLGGILWWCRGVTFAKSALPARSRCSSGRGALLSAPTGSPVALPGWTPSAGRSNAGDENGAQRWVFALSAVVLVKLAVAVIPVVTSCGNRLGRLIRAVAWISAAVLVIYGGLLTVVGLVVQADVVHASADADPKALAWHAYLWDPWFLLWGLLVLTALVASRRPGGRR